MAMNPQNSKTQRWTEWRTDPNDGKSYNYNELKGYYMSTAGWTEDHVRFYWYNFCVVPGDKKGMGKMASANSQSSRGGNSMKGKASGAMNQAVSATSEKSGKGKKGDEKPGEKKAEAKKAGAKKAAAPAPAQAPAPAAAGAGAEASEEVAPTSSSKKKKKSRNKKNKKEGEEAAPATTEEGKAAATTTTTEAAPSAPSPAPVANGVAEPVGCFQGCMAGFKKMLGQA